MSRFLANFLKKDRLALARLDARGKGSVVSCISIVTVTRVLFPRPCGSARTGFSIRRAANILYTVPSFSQRDRCVSRRPILQYRHFPAEELR